MSTLAGSYIKKNPHFWMMYQVEVHVGESKLNEETS